jgi:hypothetical protein
MSTEEQERQKAQKDEMQIEIKKTIVIEASPEVVLFSKLLPIQRS